MTYDYFVASRFRNKDFILPFVKQLREKGKTVYCFLETEPSQQYVGGLDADAEESMKQFEAITDYRNDPRVREIFETDMTALHASDTLVLLLPAGRSSHVEAGVAYGLDKKLVLVGEQKETESLYLIFNEVYNTADEFFNSI
ncbi:MAG TPA: hypothetical protein DDW36_04070 [Candidatus Magasanikbacteria bacterium]|nr:hypothetical protein [Candidatus Magasanikbacteria bacterium]